MKMQPGPAMIRFPSVLLGLFAVSPAFAAAHGSGSVAVSCPQAGSPLAGVDDGCSGASPFINSVLSYPNAAFFTDPVNGGFQSAQHALSRPTQAVWNVAGIDYAVGVKPGSYCGDPVAC